MKIISYFVTTLMLLICTPKVVFASTISVELHTEKHMISYGENLTLRVTIHNKSDKPVTIHGLRFNAARPQLIRLTEAEPIVVKRSSNRGSRVVFGAKPVKIDAGESYMDSIVLFNDLYASTQLVPGEHKLSIRYLGSVVNSDGEYDPIEINYEKTQIKLTVKDDNGDADAWVKIVQQYYTIEKSSQKANFIKRVIQNKAFRNHVNILKYELAILLLDQHLAARADDRGSDTIRHVVKAIDDYTAAPESPDILKQIIEQRAATILTESRGGD